MWVRQRRFVPAVAASAVVAGSNHPPIDRPSCRPKDMDPGETTTMKKITALFAALLLTFAVVACNDDEDPTDAPAESPAATEEASE